MKKRRSGVVSVVLVNFRGADDTVECVRGLRELNWPAERLEIVVVENGSGDDSLEKLRALGDDIVLIDSGANLGFTGGCNLGVSKSSGEFVAFLNNDARPDPDWIAAAIDTFATGRDIGAVASKVLDWEGRDVDFVDGSVTWYGMGYKPHAGEQDRGSWDTEKDVLFGTGAAMFVRAEVFEALDGFDDDYFMFYDDVDLGWRLNLLGYRFRFQPASLAFHKHHASMNKFGNFREEYLLERNALYTLYKNLGDEFLADTFAGALLLAVRRGVGRGGLDSTVFDLRKPGGDDQPALDVPKSTMAPVFAIDQLVELLPQMTEKRRAIQATRVRSDRELMALFGKLDEPAYPIESYLDGYSKIVASLEVLEKVGRRRRILVVTGDPIGARMAGPAIRVVAHRRRAVGRARRPARHHDVGRAHGCAVRDRDHLAPPAVHRRGAREVGRRHRGPGPRPGPVPCTGEDVQDPRRRRLRPDAPGAARAGQRQHLPAVESADRRRDAHPQPAAGARRLLPLRERQAAPLLARAAGRARPDQRVHLFT